MAPSVVKRKVKPLCSRLCHLPLKAIPPMEENIKVTCPCCNSILVIRRRDGKLLETREPIVEESTGDRFEDAFLKVKARPRAVDEKVNQLKQKEAERLKGADDFFKQALARAKQDNSKPINPLERD